jgi:hypothetical protein
MVTYDIMFDFLPTSVRPKERVGVYWWNKTVRRSCDFLSDEGQYDALVIYQK